ncbi:FISUMP domain-containing protein, partial [Neptuniibacter sp.]|uniref:FISUMP domain-containing protein n=1 Tax=Neptuniibacter sp. TaxID=1962643 RepID=UPI0026053BCF
MTLSFALNVTSVSGKTWMDRNLGASQVATSSTDVAAYGDLYQWGRVTDGHEKRTSSTTSTLSSSDTPGHGYFITSNSSPYDWRSPKNDMLWQGVNGINNPCPGGYRLPTKAEWEDEIGDWISPDAAGAFASPLKLT